VAAELTLSPQSVGGALALFHEGATLPFIARYRKEATGGLDEVELRDVRDRARYLEEMEERRTAILTSIEEQEKLTRSFGQASSPRTPSRRWKISTSPTVPSAAPVPPWPPRGASSPWPNSSGREGWTTPG
jgi:hypothetical protein